MKTKGYAKADFGLVDCGKGLRLRRVWFACDKAGNRIGPWQIPRKAAIAESQRILGKEVQS